LVEAVEFSIVSFPNILDVNGFWGEDVKGGCILHMDIWFGHGIVMMWEMVEWLLNKWEMVGWRLESWDMVGWWEIVMVI